MSVTFYAYQKPIGWSVNTWCGNDIEDLQQDRDTAILAAASHDIGCRECTEQQGSFVAQVEAIEPVQMSNSNAYDVLEALGYASDELAGRAEAEDIIGRATLARALLEISPEIPSGTIRGDGATMIYLGREAGYVNRRIEQILSLAGQAREVGVPVTWG